MKSRPLAEALLVLLLGAALLFPLLHVTGDRARAADTEDGVPPDAETAADDTHCWITVRSPHPMRRVEVAKENGHREINDTGDTFHEYEFTTHQPIGPTGFELELRVAWAPDTPESVVEVVVEPDGLDRRVATAWGEGEVHAFLDFQW